MLGFFGEVGTIFLGVFDFSILLTVSIFFFDKIVEVMASSTTLGFDFPFLSTFSLGESHFLGNAPLAFLTSSICASDSLGNGTIILEDVVLCLILSTLLTL